MNPLVSVVCLCYNHAPYICEALESVFAQEYPHWELYIVDDASTDDSARVIEAFLQEKSALKYPQKVVFLRNQENLGNCRSFNLAYRQTQGAYIVDLAGDDVLLPARLQSQVRIFADLPPDYGVVFSNAHHIDASGEVLHAHHTGEAVPTGDIYLELFRRYFICTPTMLMRRQVLEDLGGYDEDLSYEDFDFWVRSARRYRYFYQDEITTLKRRVQGSLSTKFYQAKRNPHLVSTLKVLEKTLALNKNQEENEALQVCAGYHLRQAFFMQDFALVGQYEAFWRRIPQARLPFWARVICLLAHWRVPVLGLYRGYLRMRYGR